MMTTWTDELTVDLPDGDQVCVDVTCSGEVSYDHGGGDYAPCWDHDASCLEYTVQEDADVTTHYKDFVITNAVDAAILHYLDSPDQWPWVQRMQEEPDYDDR